VTERASDLLFPAADGGFLSEHCLRTPFARVGGLIGLEMKFTPRGLRRTFNDLARTAKVEALVTKSISGPLFNSMKSVLTHTVYGVGLYLAALATASLLTAGT
jgi:hypothetical protein